MVGWAGRRAGGDRRGSFPHRRELSQHDRQLATSPLSAAAAAATGRPRRRFIGVLLLPRFSTGPGPWKNPRTPDREASPLRGAVPPASAPRENRALRDRPASATS